MTGDKVRKLMGVYLIALDDFTLFSLPVALTLISG
jgi:hypothetical protein